MDRSSPASRRHPHRPGDPKMLATYIDKALAAGRGITRKGCHRGGARTDRLVAGPADGAVRQPAAFPRQRQQDFSRPHGKSRRRGGDGANYPPTAAAVFITGKLWNFFAGQMPSPELNNALADAFIKSARRFKPSCASCSAARSFTRVRPSKSGEKPVQWLVGTARMLQCDLPPAFISAACCAASGRICSRRRMSRAGRRHHLDHDEHLLERYNDAATLVQGTTQQLTHPILRANPAGRAESFRKKPRNVFTSRRGCGKILTPEERADKNKLVASLQHGSCNPLFPTSRTRPCAISSIRGPNWRTRTSATSSAWSCPRPNIKSHENNSSSLSSSSSSSNSNFFEDEDE